MSREVVEVGFHVPTHAACRSEAAGGGRVLPGRAGRGPAHAGQRQLRGHARPGRHVLRAGLRARLRQERPGDEGALAAPGPGHLGHGDRAQPRARDPLLLALARAGLRPARGRGRAPSTAVSLTIMDVTDIQAPSVIYRGPLRYVGARPLGFLGRGERRSFSFLAERPAGGPSPVVTAELPGVSPDDVEISVVGETLTIHGDRKSEEVDEKATYHRQERACGQFNRSIELPFMVESDKVSAKLEKGLLTITLPRAEQDKPRRISVNS